MGSRRVVEMAFEFARDATVAVLDAFGWLAMSLVGLGIFIITFGLAVLVVAAPLALAVLLGLLAYRALVGG